MTDQWTPDRGREAIKQVLEEAADQLSADPDLSLDAAIAVQSVVQLARIAEQLGRLADMQAEMLT
jgi:hypothetical protein